MMTGTVEHEGKAIMTQATDIVLDGAGYMLAPGPHAYKRTQDGIAEGRTGRTSIKDFFGGQLRPFQLERDRFWAGSRIGPAYNGQGVRPWANIVDADLAPSGIPAINVSSPMLTCVADDWVFFAYGTKLLRTTNIGNSTWGGIIAIYTAPQMITSIDSYNGQIIIGQGSSGDILVGTGALPSVGTPAALATGERGDFVRSYSGFAIWNDRRASAETNAIRMVSGTGFENRYLDNRILNICQADGKLWAITRNAIYSFSGRARYTTIANPAWTSGGSEPAQIPGWEWSGEWEPFFQHGNYTDDQDHRFFIGFGGRMYTNIGGFIGEFRPNGDRAGWRDTGLHYVKCHGAAVAAGYLVVAIETQDQRSQVWAWDGSGWWNLLDKPYDGAPYCHPCSLAGIAGWDVVVFTHAVTTYKRIRLIPKSHTLTAMPETGLAHWISPLIDANERDKQKAWRKIGCIFADPDPPTNVSTDAITVSLDYSIDNGATWVSAASQVLTGNTHANHQVTLTGNIGSAAAVSNLLMLRVRWESLTDWAPTLVDAWAEYEMLDSPARRRKWLLRVKAADQVIDREGAPLAVTGRQLINQLWTDWQTGTTITFRDIDYDDVAVQRNVRITGIEEDTERPADHGRWGDSVIRLVLVEV
jgi:hypothetical protein